jgi:FkbM family methyltransferase
VSELTAQLAEQYDKITAASKLMSTDPSGLELWQTPYGRFWSPKGNALLFDLAEQEVDVYESSKGERMIQAGDVVIDCGANVGTFTRKALNAGASRVIAFDIDPRNLECLRRTFADEISASRVIVIPKGVWDKEDQMQAKFYTNTNLNTVVMQSRSETTEKPRVVTVPLTRIDTVVQELGLTRVNLIKMDVEGAEPNALKGAKETIQKFRPRLMIATENELDDIDKVPAAIQGSGIPYTQKSGDCRRIRKWDIRPEAVSFIPR